MSSVVADTHSVVWYLATPENLSPKALAALEGAEQANEPIYVAAVSVVEVAYLVEKGRLPEITFQRLVQTLSDPDSGLVVVALDLAIAQTLRRIPRALVPDMPDRIIAATALFLDLPLVTRDSQIQSVGLKTVW